MPSGRAVAVEEFEEFGKALKAFQETAAFHDAMKARIKAGTHPLVLTEGKTDPDYLRAALKAHAKEEVTRQVDIESVTPGDGGGKSNLDHVARLWRGTPSLRNRPLLLLYDCDARKALDDGHGLSIRGLPQRAENTIMRAGIENLLPQEVITDDFRTTEKRTKDDGTEIILRPVDKTKLCGAICTRADPQDFRFFGPAVAMIDEFLAAAKAPSTTKPST